MVAQNIGVRGGEGLDLSKGNGGENECGEENYDGEGTHGGQYGADSKDRQDAHRRLERTALRFSAKSRDDTMSLSRGNR